MYIYARKKHPFTSYPAAKHPKHVRKAIGLFLLYGILLLSSRYNFANLGSFTKVSVPVKSKSSKNRSCVFSKSVTPTKFGNYTIVNARIVLLIIEKET